MVPMRGMGGTWGIGVESTWGTPVARSNWKVMNSFGLRRTRSKKPVPELGRLGQASSNPRFFWVENDFAGGPFQFDACYDDSTVLLLGHILGTIATTGAGPFTHTATLSSPQVQAGLTIEQINGTATADLTTTTEVFEGCKIGAAKITLTNGGIFTVEGEVIAQTSGGLTTPGTPSYTAGERILHNHAVLTIGGTARPFNSISIDLDRVLTRNHEIGSLFTSEPFEDGEMSVQLELRCKYQQNVFDTSLLADTQSDLQIVFTGSGSNAMTLTAHNILIEDVQRDVNSKGGIEQVIKARAYADGTDQGLAIAFTNANATATTN